MIQSATSQGGQERVVTDLNKSVNENASPVHVPQLFIQKYIEEVVLKAGHRREEAVLPDKEDNTNRKRLL